MGDDIKPLDDEKLDDNAMEPMDEEDDEELTPDDDDEAEDDDKEDSI